MKATDPVCGMTVDPKTAKGGTSDFGGHPYYFCSSKCKIKFDLNPASYADKTEKKNARPTEASAADMQRTYTCPMHPEIRQLGPGSCPICGMALEPEVASLEDTENPELVDFTKRLKVATVFSIPLLLLAMSDLIPGQPVQHALLHWQYAGLQFLLATPVVLWCGQPFFQRGWRSLVTRKLNMFTLIALGTGVAYAFSVLATFLPSLFPESLRVHGGQVPLYFEAAAVITALVLLGQVLELRARNQTGQAIRSLLKLAPKTTKRLNEDGSEEEVGVELIRVGDRIRIHPGQQIPVDGHLVEGRSVIDESMITGEPIPVEKQIDSAVTGGTVNTTGSFVMVATKVGSETLLSQIVKMVSEAQRSRAPIQKLADTVASYFVPAVVLISVLTFAAWSYWGPDPKLTYALINAVAVLIIACPCALGLATPMSIMVGTGKGATHGVLFKNAESLERLQKMTTLVVDKTGTLTEGKPKLAEIYAAEGFTQTEVLQIAASLEKLSEHPLAAAIVSGATERGLKLEAVENFESITGRGIQGDVQGRKVLAGNRAFLKENGIATETLAESGHIFVAIDSKAAGAFSVEDPIKESAKVAIEYFHKQGIRVVMLTGDNRKTAETVARAVGIDDFQAEVLPAEKHAAIKKLQAEGQVVAMAGDGINDAPALAQADIGIAMGTGTDVAIKSASVTLVKGDLMGIVRGHKLSKDTMRNIKQNLVFAFGYNTLGVPIAAGVLYPFFGILLSPMIASFAMSLSSVSVIANSLRLR